MSIANAETFYILDFDGSVTNAWSLKSPWKTSYTLVKIPNISDISQWNLDAQDAPKKVKLSFAEYLEFEEKMARGDRIVGSTESVRLEADPLMGRPEPLMIPIGYYMIDPNFTYERYKEGPNGENFLLEDLRSAQQRIKNGGLKKNAFHGLAMPLLQQGTSDPSKINNTFIFTARDHSQDSWNEFFEALRTDKVIQNARGYRERVNGRQKMREPTHIKVYNLQGWQSLLLSRHLSEGKVAVIDRLTQSLAGSQKPMHTDFDVTRSGELVEIKTHTIIIAEDDPVNLREVFVHIRNISSIANNRKIKFVLLNTGPEIAGTDKHSGFGELNNIRWAVIKDGQVRPAHKKEIDSYLGKTSKSSSTSPTRPNKRGSKQIRPLQCKALFARLK